MSSRLMMSFRQFRSVDNFSSWPSYPWIATSLCIAQRVGEFSFTGNPEKGVALQSSITNGTAPGYACRARDRRSTVTVAI
jgi:hypothetical protein